MWGLSQMRSIVVAADLKSLDIEEKSVMVVSRDSELEKQMFINRPYPCSQTHSEFSGELCLQTAMPTPSGVTKAEPGQQISGTVGGLLKGPSPTIFNGGISMHLPRRNLDTTSWEACWMNAKCLMKPGSKCWWAAYVSFMRRRHGPVDLWGLSGFQRSCMGYRCCLKSSSCTPVSKFQLNLGVSTGSLAQYFELYLSHSQ